EQAVGESGAADVLEPPRGDDLVGVHVGALERDRTAGDASYPGHQRSPGSVKCPATAVAAATAGETRCVRAPGPWRPSKFLLHVDAQRWPGPTVSPFMAR